MGQTQALNTLGIPLPKIRRFNLFLYFTIPWNLPQAVDKRKSFPAAQHKCFHQAKRIKDHFISNHTLKHVSGFAYRLLICGSTIWITSIRSICVKYCGTIGSLVALSPASSRLLGRPFGQCITIAKRRRAGRMGCFTILNLLLLMVYMRLLWWYHNICRGLTGILGIKTVTSYWNAKQTHRLAVPNTSNFDRSSCSLMGILGLVAWFLNFWTSIRS